jgi:hypothetical protein
MKFLKAFGLMIVFAILLAALAQAGEVATRTGTLTGSAVPAGGTVTWTNSTDWASAEILYVDAFTMIGGSASTLTVYRVSTNYTETLGTIAGNATTSNGQLCLKTSNVGKDLVQGDKIRIDALATNVAFKAQITYKLLKP